jgi:hypothetical protein
MLAVDLAEPHGQPAVLRSQTVDSTFVPVKRGHALYIQT